MFHIDFFYPQQLSLGGDLQTSQVGGEQQSDSSIGTNFHLQ